MASCYEATQKRANLLATEDLYETGQHRLHSIDLSLLARYDLTAKFLDFRILDGRPVLSENSIRAAGNVIVQSSPAGSPCRRSAEEAKSMPRPECTPIC